MRKIKIPRILKINWIQDLSISVVFNNGESRVLDFRKFLQEIGVTDNSPEAILFKAEEFAKVKLVDNTLSWDNVEQYISKKNGDKQSVPYEIGPDVLLTYSLPEKPVMLSSVGKMIRESRIRIGLSQEQLAMISGTSRTYISRIENDRSDIELDTLRKIVETGLGKKLEIKIV
jgi:DNA-binding XRE family transcriptional regulator